MDEHIELIRELRNALSANMVFAEKIAEELEIETEETVIGVKVMPEGREVVAKSWAEVLREGRAAVAKAEGV